MMSGLGWLALAAAIVVTGVACAAPAPSSRAAPQGSAPQQPAASAPQPAAQAAVAPAAPAAPRELRKIKVAFATASASYMDHYAAFEKGYYLEEGLDIERIQAGGGASTPALVAGELDFSTSAGSALSAMLHGAEIKVIYTNLDRPAYQVWSSSPDIRSTRDLIGKQVGVPTRGDTHELSIRLLLRQHGVDPNAVIYTQLGSGSARLVAIEAGSVQATTLSPLDLGQIKEPKGHLLGDIEKEVKLVYTGVATSNKLLADEPGLVERFLRGAVKGREYVFAHRSQAIGLLSKYTEVGREVSEAEYDVTVRTMTEEGWVADDALRAEVLTRADIVQMANPPDASTLFDYSIVKRVYADLRARGWRPAP